jgi:hypothetical protein
VNKGSLTWPVSDLFSYLAGSWQVERRIDDHKLNQSGSLEGIAEFILRENGLEYREAGELRMGNYSGMAERRLDFRRTDRMSAADIRFADGRAFYILDLQDGTWSTIHECDPDLYRVCTQATGPGSWHQHWTIEGPRKQQEILTNYYRVPR